MVLGTKKYNREIEALRQAAANESGLHPLRMAQLKAELMQELSLPVAPRAERGLLVEVRRVHTSFVFRYVLPTLAGVSVVGGTVLASGGALPGSTLYPVKRLKEKVELSLSVTAQGKAQVRASQAEERLRELEQVSPVVAVEPTTLSVAATALTEPAELAPGKPNDTPRHDEREEKVRAEAQVQVETALGSLAEVRASLKAKGRVNEASDVGRTIKRLKDEALRHRLEVRFNDDEEDNPELPKVNTEVQDSGKKNRSSDVGKQGEGEPETEDAVDTTPAGIR
jgi:hypothetical protein